MYGMNRNEFCNLITSPATHDILPSFHNTLTLRSEFLVTDNTCFPSLSIPTSTCLGIILFSCNKIAFGTKLQSGSFSSSTIFCNSSILLSLFTVCKSRDLRSSNGSPESMLSISPFSPEPLPSGFNLGDWRFDSPEPGTFCNESGSKVACEEGKGSAPCWGSAVRMTLWETTFPVCSQ